MSPVFPEFGPIELSDRTLFTDFFVRYRPETSELTFTNLFIWRAYYRWEWSILDDRLVLVAARGSERTFALMPIGPPPRASIAKRLLGRLRDEGAKNPSIERADERFAAELVGDPDFVVEPSQEHFDYVYRATDLIELAGRKYHSKRNFLNRFALDYSFAYEPIEERHIAPCRELADRWCMIRLCEDDMGLAGEHAAVTEALVRFFDLSLLGGVITIDGRVAAFALGEALNDDTAVVHVEKADPNIRGLYAAINHEFAKNALAGFASINREQDLGDEGLRKAKESYYPERLEKKCRVTMR
jgi:hypothetical protein